MKINIALIILSLISCAQTEIAKNTENALINNISNNRVIEKFFTNNIPVALVENKSLPIITFDFKFRKAGQISDFIGKEGLAKLSILSMIENIDDASSKRLGEIGTRIDINAPSLDNLYISLTCLKEHLQESLNILNSILNDRNIKKKNIEIARNKFISDLNYIDSNPSSIAVKEFKNIIFNNHPYSKTVRTSKNIIALINDVDISNYLKNNIRNDNLILNIVGDINKEEIEKSFLSFSIASNTAIENTDSKFKEMPKVDNYKIIDKKFEQANIVFGTKVNIDKEDVYKFKILNHIIGGRGMQSRLMKEIRDKRGLSYGAHTNIEKYELTSVWIGNTATKNENVNQVVKLIKEELSKFSLNSITEEELSRARTSLISDFILNLDTNEATCHIISHMKYDRIKQDYFQTRSAKINEITLNDINNFARDFFKSNEIAFVIVGDEAIIDKNIW